MRFYIATSADNPHTKRIQEKLLSLGHTYYHFLEGDVELDYNDVHPDLRNLNPKLQSDFRHDLLVETAFHSNYRAVRNADVFLLAEPANKGCYTEYGMAVALAIPTVLIITSDYQLGVMDAGFMYAGDVSALPEIIKQIGK